MMTRGRGAFAVFRGRRAMSSPVLQKQPRYFLSIAGIMENPAIGEF
jgi:hypothetical protein